MDCEEVIGSLPDDKLLAETDFPYFRGIQKQSSPAMVEMVVNMVADIRGQTWKYVLEVFSCNTSRFFGVQLVGAFRQLALSTGYPLRGSKLAQER